MKLRGILVALVGLSLGIGSAWAKGPTPVTEEIIKKIEAALPDKAPAVPQKARKVLVFTLATGFVHSSIPVGAKAFELMGKKTGAFEATVSDDIEMFMPEKLNQFDAVVFLSTTGELFGLKGDDFKKLPADKQEHQQVLRKSLMDFINGGKGIMGIHAATDCSYHWAEYGTMMGGYFNGHPWHEKVTITPDDLMHPINAAFEGKPFEVTDEIYQFKEPYSRNIQHVLTKMVSSEKDPELKKGKRTDHDYAVSWCKNVGQGHLFYCSIGHREEIYWNPTMLKHYLAGLQFAMGDLKAEAAPNPKP